MSEVKGVYVVSESGQSSFVPCVPGKTRDAYHSIEELYDHRNLLFIALANSHPKICWKSRVHDDGTGFEGWFIAGMNLPDGPITYHLPDRLWELLRAPDFAQAPAWDGHTSQDVLDRPKQSMQEQQS